MMHNAEDAYRELSISEKRCTQIDNLDRDLTFASLTPQHYVFARPSQLVQMA